MTIQLRAALVGSVAAIVLLAAPGTALASPGTAANIEPGPTATVAMADIPPGMHVMMNAPGHENFMASPRPRAHDELARSSANDGLTEGCPIPKWSIVKVR